MSKKRAMMKKREAMEAAAKKKKPKEKRPLTLEEMELRAKKIKKISIISACVLAVAIIATIIIVLVATSVPDIDMEFAKTSLKSAGYEISDNVPEAKQFTGVTEKVLASFALTDSDDLSAIVNAGGKRISFVCFDTEENAEKAYGSVKDEWGDIYEEYGVSNNIIFFGSTEAFEIATTK